MDASTAQLISVPFSVSHFDDCRNAGSSSVLVITGTGAHLSKHGLLDSVRCG